MNRLRVFIYVIFLLFTNSSFSETCHVEIVSEEYADLTRAQSQEAEWLFVVYVAGDNNLYYLLWNNIKQMAKIGSNGRITIVVQVNEPGINKKTQRYLIEENRAVLLNKDDVAAGKKLDSGNPETLADFVSTVVKQFPAKHICVILSDHGTGIIDPILPKTINPSDLFQLNPTDLMLELNRSLSYLDLIEPIFDRGICFDDTFHTYLNNQNIQWAFNQIHQRTGRNIDIVGMDACLMQMTEVGKILRECGAPLNLTISYMIGSQEVELGAGWDYEQVLKPFKTHSLEPRDFAQHIIQCYNNTYSKITKDYTLSALDLSSLDQLEENVDGVAKLMLQLLVSPQAAPIKRALLSARSRYNVTCFEEPSYVDLGHLYKNLLQGITAIQIPASDASALLKERLLTNLRSGIDLIEKLIVANATGKNLTRASGLSIYFPEKRIHSSYYRTTFAMANNWISLLEHYVKEAQA